MASIGSDNPSKKKEIVIVGAGIIGVCTAYYLTKHPNFSKDTHHITILEARRPAGAASGKAGGLLAMWAFPQQIVPLSFKLHKELAEEFNGSAEWGYRGLKTLCIEGNISSSHLRNLKNGTVKPNPDINLPEELDWISPEIIDGWTHLGDGEATAQVHPYKFTLFILKKVLETGAVDLVTGKVTEVTFDSDGKANGVKYTTTQDKSRFNHHNILSSVQQPQPSPQKESSAQASVKPDPSSSKKQQNKSSLHHPDNPVFKSDASILPASNIKNTTTNSNNSAQQPSSETSGSSSQGNTFRNIHNTSYTASATPNSNTESSEESLNFSTDDDESLIDENGYSEEPESTESSNHSLTSSKADNENTPSDTTTTKETSEQTEPKADTHNNTTESNKNNTNEVDAKNTTTFTATSKVEKVTSYLTGDQIVLTLGPWTSKLLPSCPISGLRAHSITIQPSKQVSPFALFTEMRTSRVSYVSPEIYPRRDEVYVCGEGDTSADVPETSDDVEVVRDRCDELFKHVSAVSSTLKNGRILKRQACYLPVVDVPSHSGPFIGSTNVDNLYLASGHSCWGINNAPATGLLMSEILLDGEALSASVDGLEPEFYFDASPQ